ncbi:acyl dehydratase [Chloroflexota bacterium]
MAYKKLSWEDVNEGDELPKLIKEVTATTVIAGAIASRDFMPVHHDRDFARKQNAEDLFMNILTSGGWAGRYLTDWAGPEGELKKMSYRLGASCYPGHTLTWSGKVVKKYTEDNLHLVDIEYIGAVPIGNHFSGKATLSLPAKGS